MKKIMKHKRLQIELRAIVNGFYVKVARIYPKYEESELCFTTLHEAVKYVHDTLERETA